jgi:hypothetical protein
MLSFRAASQGRLGMPEDEAKAQRAHRAAPNPSIDVFTSYASQDKAVVLLRQMNLPE